MTNRRAWVLFDPEDVPERWRHRGVPMMLIPLLPDELGDALGLDRVMPGVDPEDEPLLRLVARGETSAAIARQLHTTTRTVQRRIARMCRRFRLASRAELVRFLAERGF